MLNNKTVLFWSLLLLSLASTAQMNKKIGGSYVYETECLGSELDGSQTLKAWGTGKNRADAVEQAKKNAVNEVLFNGIIKGKAGCNNKPLMLEVNSREKYENYFNAFFADNGLYKEFVSTKDEPRFPLKKKDRKVGVKEVEFGVIVRVLRDQLKKKLITDKIIKP